MTKLLEAQAEFSLASKSIHDNFNSDKGKWQPEYEKRSEKRYDALVKLWDTKFAETYPEFKIYFELRCNTPITKYTNGQIYGGNFTKTSVRVAKEHQYVKIKGKK